MTTDADLPPIERYQVHTVLLDHLGVTEADTLLDLGCGNGGVLVEAAERWPGMSLVGVDRDETSLGQAAAWLDRLGARHILLQADLSKPFDLPASSVTKVVCHNVLECLPDPLMALLNAVPLMRPGAVSLWSHIDFDSTVISGAGRELTRRIVHAYADLTEAGMDCSDGQMGRKLAALVDRSPLERTGVASHVSLTTELGGGARMRIDRMVAGLSDAGEGATDVTAEEVETWLSQLQDANQRGEFFYAHTTYMVTARSPQTL